MSDWRDEAYARRSAAAERETPLSELVDGAVRKVVTALVIAGALIGLGAYASGRGDEAPNYQVTTTSDGRIVRLNTENGTILLCDGNRCGLVVRRGQDLEDEPPPPRALPKAEARPSLPAPAAAPDNAAVAPPAAR